MTMNKAALAAIVLAGSVGLYGCGDKAPPPPANPFAARPFVLAPDRNGNLELLAPDGTALAPTDKPPEAAGNLRNLGAGTVMKLESPCVYWVYFNGRWYRVPC